MLEYVPMDTKEQSAKLNWDAIKIVPRDSKPGHPRAHCETCALPIWSAGGYQVPSPRGYYCTILCIEQKLFGTKKTTARHGERLVQYLKDSYPELFRAVTGRAAHAMQPIGNLFDNLEGG